MTDHPDSTSSSSSSPWVYGPVPSRRLGRSLGVDLVPFKTCTYDCIYCQLGRTTNRTLTRRAYVPLADILAALQEKLDTTVPAPDYVSLAGSGEPTLHAQLGELIRQIKQRCDIPVAVLTNGSLLWMPDVQDALMPADLVLPSLDAGDERRFTRINRPCPGITFEHMVDGLARFTERFTGAVWLEVFLLDKITATPAEVEKIARLVRRIRPDRVQLNTVARPPAEPAAGAVSYDRLQELAAYFPEPVDIISENVTGGPPPPTGPAISEPTTTAAGSSVPATTPTTVLDDDILAVLQRRPCTVHQLAAGLSRHVNEIIKHVQVLQTQGRILSRQRDDGVYYDVPRNHQDTGETS